jgi:hypothetical protein
MEARWGDARSGRLDVPGQEDWGRHHLPPGRLSTRVQRLYGGFHDDLQA